MRRSEEWGRIPKSLIWAMIEGGAINETENRAKENGMGR